MDVFRIITEGSRTIDGRSETTAGEFRSKMETRTGEEKGREEKRRKEPHDHGQNVDVDVHEEKYT